jgi:hypothetical protein
MRRLMKHLAQVQTEYLKMAGWDESPEEAQRRYLRQHPRSRRRLHPVIRQPMSDMNRLINDVYTTKNMDPESSIMQSDARSEATVINLKPSYFDKKTNTFSFEASTAGVSGGSKEVYLRNPRTGVKVLFELFKTDKDASDEDTYGWWYQSLPKNRANGEGSKYKLLIIND